VALELERRFTKAQIFELYANEFISEIGEFLHTWFRRGVFGLFQQGYPEISLPEAAFLAGIIHGRTVFHGRAAPERAAEARDRALLSMTENGAIHSKRLRKPRSRAAHRSEPDSREARRPIL